MNQLQGDLHRMAKYQAPDRRAEQGMARETVREAFRIAADGTMGLNDERGVCFGIMCMILAVFATAPYAKAAALEEYDLLKEKYVA